MFLYLLNFWGWLCWYVYINRICGVVKFYKNCVRMIIYFGEKLL